MKAWEGEYLRSVLQAKDPRSGESELNQQPGGSEGSKTTGGAPRRGG